MKIKFIVFLILLSGTCFAQSQNNRLDFKGETFRYVNQLNQFKGYKEIEGALIQPVGSDYGISNISNGINTIILFEKVIHADNGKVNYQILDTINVGRLPRNKSIIMMGCLINKKDDPEVIGLIKSTEKKGYFTPLEAWRANRKTNTIQKIPVKGIDCAALVGED